jgi:hypothetical protein
MFLILLFFGKELEILIFQETEGYAGTNSELHISVQILCDEVACMYRIS